MRAHGGEDVGGLFYAGPGNPLVGVAAGEEGWGAGERVGGWIGAGELGVGRADEAAGPGDEAGVAGGVGRDELGGKAGALREAG